MGLVLMLTKRNNRYPFGANQAGFSLLDALITVAIIAIISSIAFPSYESSTKKARRSDAIQDLQGIMQQQERFFLNNMRYTADLTELGYAADPYISEDEFYSISAAACAGALVVRCVNLTAQPRGGHSGDGDITLNSRGEEGATGDAAAADAWRG